jgi:hypothetical protein
MASRQDKHFDIVAQEGMIWLPISYLLVLQCKCFCLDGKPYLTFLCYYVNVFILMGSHILSSCVTVSMCRQDKHIHTVVQEGKIWLPVKANILTL